MRRETLLLVLGILVFVTPLLGVPYMWKDTAHFIFGASVALIAIVYRMDARRRERSHADVFHEEHNPNNDSVTVDA